MLFLSEGRRKCIAAYAAPTILLAVDCLLRLRAGARRFTHGAPERR